MKWVPTIQEQHYALGGLAVGLILGFVAGAEYARRWHAGSQNE